MLGAMQMPRKVSVLERILASLVLFFSAVVFCLPVPTTEEVASLYPWWGKRIAIGNVLLHELLFISWVVAYGRNFVLRALFSNRFPTRQAAVWLIALAFWCGLMSLTAPLPWQDIGRTFRLLLNAALLFAVVSWTWKMDVLPMVMVILGFLVGTIINLTLSFKYPVIVLETMRLSGQNTPGVAMGMAIHLSGWLFLRTSHRSLQALVVISTLVFAFGCGISYSRVGWFVGVMGLLAWTYILISARPREGRSQLRDRKPTRMWFLVLVLGVAAFLMSAPAQQGLQWISVLVAQKFSPESTSSEGDHHRASYFIGVGEILARYPAGVGYSGFFDAMTSTDVYQSGLANEEVDYEANPHSSFLYYAAAGGIPGVMMIIAVFAMLLNSMRVGLVSAFGRQGMVCLALAVPAYLLIGLTVPYLINSIILIVPVAIAAGWGWSRRSEVVMQEASSQQMTKYRHANQALRSS